VTITSAVPNEGKTLTAANLALTLSESYQRRVLLIDADLRHPSTHTLFGVANAYGLSDTLAGRRPLPFVRVTQRLTLLTAGTASADPVRTLSSDPMRGLVEDARAQFDWVLFDTAPIGLLTDAGLLASMVDGALLVARASSTAYDVIQRAAEVVGTERILGLVLNGVDGDELSPAQYSGYYGPRSE
jgi:capsular exopolysaccharide synthesis family protein